MSTSESAEAKRGGIMRYTCPYCDTTNVVIRGASKPERDLKIHVSSSIGDGHGEQDELPDDFPPNAELDQYIESAE